MPVVPLEVKRLKQSAQDRFRYAQNPFVRQAAQRELAQIAEIERDCMAGLGASRGGFFTPKRFQLTRASTSMSVNTASALKASVAASNAQTAIIRPPRRLGRGQQGQAGQAGSGEDLIGRLEARLEELKRRRLALDSKLTVARARALDGQIKALSERIDRLKAGQVPQERMQAEATLLERQAANIETEIAQNEAVPEGQSVLSKQGVTVPENQPAAPAAPSAPATAPPAPEVPWYKKPAFLGLGAVLLLGGGGLVAWNLGKKK